MKRAATLCWLGCVAIARLQAAELKDLSVLYIGDGDSPRAESFKKLIAPETARYESVARVGFNPTHAEKYDVVLLDWPQSELARHDRQGKSPLGNRAEWTKPTVLLGSAGLNLAIAWQMRGGSGCTCLHPFAYMLRPHSIFSDPFVVNTNSMVDRPTPEAFKSGIKSTAILTLPLVEETARNWHPGWCTYTDHFEKNPDIEVVCGGENEKAATAAAIWRQGHLLHFGFEQDPNELNDNGRKLLLNSIAYISRFTEDRPIAVTPSIFAGPVTVPRTYLDRRIRGTNDPKELEWMVTPELFGRLMQMKTEERRPWYEKHRSYLHPSDTPEKRLEVDGQALQLGAGIDEIEFFKTCISVIDTQSIVAEALLKRYGPGETRHLKNAKDWQTWFAKNRAYLFFSDSADYRWYIDPLARKRGKASDELRGIARASVRTN
jgi:hypothetical protein